MLWNSSSSWPQASQTYSYVGMRLLRLLRRGSGAPRRGGDDDARGTQDAALPRVPGARRGEDRPGRLVGDDARLAGLVQGGVEGPGGRDRPDLGDLEGLGELGARQ